MRITVQQCDASLRKDQLHLSQRNAAMAARAALGCALALAFCACAGAHDTPTLRYEVVATHPHDTRAFTQGLAVLDGKLLEGTGRFGASALLLKEIESGATLRRRALDARHFGEGLARVRDRIVQLTWTSGIALVYDLELNRRGEFAYEGQGWGLAFDGRRLLMSDGSERITFRDPVSFAAGGHIVVRDRGRPVPRLNELEFAQGWLYANVWQTDRIAVIDPASGAVGAWLDLAALRGRFRKPAGWNESEHVLNGIAYDADSGHFYVTGKCWPALFELKVADPPARRANQ